LTISTVRQHAAQERGGVATEEFCPVRMMEVELAGPLPAVRYDAKHQRLFILGRLHSEPVAACTVHTGQSDLTPDQLASALWPDFRESVAERFVAAGLPAPRALTGEGLKTGENAWPFLESRRAVLAEAPFISVVICTRDRPDQLTTCLRRLDQQDYPKFEVVVVDNAPTSDIVRTLVDAVPGEHVFRYVREPRAGLSWARNAGIAAATGEIIAFLDDDEEPDRHWLAALAGGFARADDIGCVSGLVLPARLDTRPQELFEQLGGHCKGRGFTSAIFTRSGAQSPLFPLPPFGVGANMSFRREVLARIGGFDVALGAGTPAFACEDTLALTLVLLAGYRIMYEPTALTRHHHREDLDGLESQLRGYAIGLTAYYAALLRHRPGVLLELLRLAPCMLGYIRGSRSDSTLPAQDLPVDVKRQQRRWMLRGPVAYFSSLRKQARIAAVNES
jgi:glycosyltransferase involved in cell wall biosynthesis